MSTRVYLLDNGTLAIDQSFFTWNHGHGKEIRFPVYAVYIDHPQGRILVDTGFDKDWVERVLPFEKPQQSPDQTIAVQLRKLGVAPDDIDYVVNSHLHFDHCCGNRLFPNATFVMSKAELRHAFVPDPWERLGYDRTLVDMPGAKMELLELNGYDYELVPGVTLIETPGHSAGHLAVVVKLGSEPPIVFPVDIAWSKENLEQKQLMGLHIDPAELLHSMVKIQNIAHRLGGRIFYPHDPEEYKGYRKAPEFYEG
ncbi:MAG: N-acyl homoserine lactonase family protein [Dehalococcoidales bacterium]|nr:N-acyl homoserine lactonase family protein [Dehalococcoidales bacterium]